MIILHLLLAAATLARADDAPDVQTTLYANWSAGDASQDGPCHADFQDANVQNDLIGKLSAAGYTLSSADAFPPPPQSADGSQNAPRNPNEKPLCYLKKVLDSSDGWRFVPNAVLIAKLDQSKWFGAEGAPDPFKYNDPHRGVTSHIRNSQNPQVVTISVSGVDTPVLVIDHYDPDKAKNCKELLNALDLKILNNDPDPFWATKNSGSQCLQACSSVCGNGSGDNDTCLLKCNSVLPPS